MAAWQRSGELASQRLPALLLDLHDEEVTGTLTLRRSGVVKAVELLSGDPVRVTSTLRDETLGHFLVKGGVISETQHRDAVQRAANGKTRLGEALVAMGVLRAEQLEAQLTLQDRHKLVTALRWPQGSWRFEAGSARGAPSASSMMDVVLVGLRDTGATDLDRLRRFDGASHELTARGQALLPAVRRTFGEQVADALRRGGAISAIERGCADRYTARNALDALELCGGVASHRLPSASVAAASGGTAQERAAPHVHQGEAALPRGVAPRRAAPPLPRGAPRAIERGAAPPSGTPELGPDPLEPTPHAPPTRRSSPRIPSLVRAGPPPRLASPRPEELVAAAPPALADAPTPPPTRRAPAPLARASNAALGLPGVVPGADDDNPDASEPLSSRTATRREVWLPSSPTREGRAFLPRTITSAAGSRAAIAGLPPRPRTESNPLYELLFDEPSDLGDDGAAPLTVFDADSGVVSADELGLASEHSREALRLRQALVAEAQRIRSADLYTVLKVERDASEEEIAAAIGERQRAFSREAYGRFALGADQPRLEEVLTAYAGARSILLDEEARRAYDHALASGDGAAAHTLDAEVAFREAEDLLSRRSFAEAIELLQGLTARAPAQADFHAALGWARWLAHGPSAAAGDAARPHLSRALEIDPEHAAAHAYRGILGARLGEDDAEVLFYLERALDLQPARADALEYLEPILIRRGELRRLERLYKRMLFRLSSNFAGRAAEIWLQLALLYADHLDEPEAALIALGNAEVLAPRNPRVAELGERVRAAAIAPRHPLEAARANLRRTRDLSAASELIRSAGETGQPDAAFLTAATMVALGTADDDMAQTYERHRRHRPALPAQPLTRAQWARLRHTDDLADLGALMDLVAPAVHHFAPIALTDAGIDPSMRVTERELPSPFARVHKRLARVFDVAPCPVYARPELERHIELVACDPPAMIAGDDALTSPERTELVCRMARVMTHAQPGRAVGGSRSGTDLRAIVLAVLREASCSSIGAQDPRAAQADAALDVLSIEARGAARAVALRLLARSNNLNLSIWSQSLPHTANRAALLLCGDIPTALAIARENGTLEQDLVEFAFSAEHAALREELGLAITP
ncbi:MAG: hypothetical protein R3B48_13315 [Kofleriaceae bacterium]